MTAFWLGWLSAMVGIAIIFAVKGLIKLARMK